MSSVVINLIVRARLDANIDASLRGGFEDVERGLRAFARNMCPRPGPLCERARAARWASTYGFKAVTRENIPGKGICLGEVKPTSVRLSAISSPDCASPSPPYITAPIRLLNAGQGVVSV